MDYLSSTPDIELLNAAEVSADSTPASITEMLCNKVFKGVPDVSDPPFLALVCNLACATKQQYACSSRSIEALGDSLRKMLGKFLAFLFDILNLKFL